ncbi:Prp3p [Sugiyamaella lignohabitans]|uniref:Prp3p n=1 Tax=Sugiyamaella lignohabitans TaxID=796027 RepID=A0A170QY79_9ASCO|nr:Prp3p [Sugiyamaella lignohabitans]ANB15967.1 Prp3p [Sugiyamaella lignohabitans]
MKRGPLESTPDEGTGTPPKKPRTGDLSGIKSQGNIDRIAEAKARVAALALKNKAKLVVGTKENSINSGGTASDPGENNGTNSSQTSRNGNHGIGQQASKSTASSAAELMAKIRQRRAQLEAATQSSGPKSASPAQSSHSTPDNNKSGSRASATALKRGPGLSTPLHPILLEASSVSTTVNESKPNLYLAKEDPQPSVNDLNEPEANPYFDSLVATKTSFDSRRKRGLAFNPHGKYIRRAEEERHQLQLDALKKKIEQAKTKASNSGLLDADIVAGERAFKPSPPPLVEWWDEPLVINPDDGYSEVDERQEEHFLSPEVITQYIQHPIPIVAPWEKSLPKQVRLHLTKRETKRMRKNDRAERHKEAQDRIRLGLDPAPPPKIKPSNVMSVFANEAIRDPTLMELRAKTEVAQRKEKHEQDNQSRKLTSEQQYEKWIAKSEREKSKGIYCAAFRIDKLSDGRHKFLVNYNAKHLLLNGMTIFNPKFCLVIVEGGFLNIKKFSKLLLGRIKWTEHAPPRANDPPLSPEDIPDLSSNRCVLVWHGQIKSSRFQKWTLNDAETEQDAKDILSRHNCEHFWVEARVL